MKRDIIVIGASAGGVEALKTLVSSLPADLDAAVFVTLHLYSRSEHSLPNILNWSGVLPAVHPWHGADIQTGRIYVAPPDYHLILQPGHVHLGHGPKENLQRPCINVMFRSAAAAYGPRVIGVLLTGMLDDGAAGLFEIQQHGGVAAVQDPKEAAYPSMPESAIRGFGVDHIVRLAEVGTLLSKLTEGEHKAADRKISQPQLQANGDLARHQTCPECNGIMTLTKLGELQEYRCHVGHRFGLKTMIAEKGEMIERAMWTVISQTEELVVLLEQIRGSGQSTGLQELELEIRARTEQASKLRELMEDQRNVSLGT